MNERITAPTTREAVALDVAIRKVLETDGWTLNQQVHLLDCLLMVRRYGREVAG